MAAKNNKSSLAMHESTTRQHSKQVIRHEASVMKIEINLEYAFGKKNAIDAAPWRGALKSGKRYLEENRSYRIELT
jgi:hypothetical protein